MRVRRGDVNRVKKKSRKLVRQRDAKPHAPLEVKERADGVETTERADRFEMERRRRYVERLYLSGMTVANLISAASRALGITEQQSKLAYLQVRNAVELAWEEERSTNRSAQVARLQNDLGLMRARMNYDVDVKGPRPTYNDVKGPRPTYNDVIRHETLLAKIQGTMAAIHVKVETDAHVRESMVAVVSNMSVDDLDKMVDEQLELERNAKAIETNGAPQEK